MIFDPLAQWMYPWKSFPWKYWKLFRRWFKTRIASFYTRPITLIYFLVINWVEGAGNGANIACKTRAHTHRHKSIDDHRTQFTKFDFIEWQQKAKKKRTVDSLWELRAAIGNVVTKIAINDEHNGCLVTYAFRSAGIWTKYVRAVVWCTKCLGMWCRQMAGWIVDYLRLQEH